MNSLLKIKEKIMRFGHAPKAVLWLLLIVAVTLICVDDGSRIKIMSLALWIATFFYMGARGRFAVPFLSFILLGLYAVAEKVTYNALPKEVFWAYNIAALLLAFAFAGLQQWMGKHAPRVFAAIAGTVYALLALPALFCLCYYLIFDAPIPPDAFYAIGQTHVEEAFQFFRDHIGLQWAVAFFAMTAAFIAVLRREGRQSQKPLWGSVVVLVVALLIAGVVQAGQNLNLLAQLPQYAVQYAKEMEKFKTDQAAKKIFTDLKAAKKEKGETVVLVIGESLNKRHMGLYGYQRDTTPMLSKLYDEGKILRFDQAYSPHTHTMQTLSLALTEADTTNDKKYFESATLLDVAKAAGYETYWISNQALYGPWDNLVSIIAESADHLTPLNKNVGSTSKTHNLDEATIGELEKIIAAPTEQNRFIVVHVMGSHGAYHERYPQAFQKYKDALPVGEFGKKFAQDKLRIREINFYDNSVLYNDTVVAELIETLNKKSGANFLLYFSDHSEDVNENLGHNSGQFTYAMTEIPMIFWASDSYKARYGARYNVLKTAGDVLFGNEHIYDTVIGLMNVKTDRVSAGNDLSSKSYKTQKTSIMEGAKEYASNENPRYHLQQIHAVLAKERQDTRIMPHRVDTTGKLSDVRAVNFKAFEIDLHFNAQTKKFDVGHDAETASGKILDDFVEIAPDKIWLDIKNLDAGNIGEAIKEFQRLKLQNFAIVESGMTEDIFSTVAQAGFHSSYYLPTGAIEGAMEAKDKKKLQEFADTIAAQAKKQKLSAVSFDISLYLFVKDYLEGALPKEIIYHTWDTDLSMRDKNFLPKIKAKDYYNDPRIKTILVSFPSEYEL